MKLRFVLAFAVAAVPFVLAQAEDPADTPVSVLIEDLHDGERALVLRALDHLRGHGAAGRTAVDAVADQAFSSDEQIQREALETLGAIGRGDRRAVPPLKYGLESSSASVRQAALLAFANIGVRDSAVKREVEKLRSDADAEVAATAEKVLRKLSSPPDSALPPPQPVETTAETGETPVISNGSAPTEIARGRLAEKRSQPAGSGEIDELNKARDTFVDFLKSKDAKLAYEGAHQLAQLVQSSLPILAENLRNDNSQVSGAASFAMSRFGSAAVPVLARGLTEEKADIRIKAAEGIRLAFPVLSRESIDHLRKMLTDQNEQVRLQGALTLATVEPGEPSSVPVLVEALRRDDPVIRAAVTVAISRMGKLAEEPLMKALQSPSADVRRGAVTALGVLVPPPGNLSEILAPLLKDSDPQVVESVKHLLNADKERAGAQS